MYKVEDIADIFVGLSNEEVEGDISNLKLNKLLYFAQGWHLALKGKPLFDNPIEAWTYGPVVPCIYRKYKEFKHCPIDSVEETSKEIDAETLSLIIDVYTAYNKFSANELLRQTHEPGTPWKECFAPREDNVIEQQKIKEWFLSQEPLEQWRFPEIPSIGYIDKDGYTVLPKEYNDD